MNEPVFEVPASGTALTDTKRRVGVKAVEITRGRPTARRSVVCGKAIAIDLGRPTVIPIRPGRLFEECGGDHELDRTFELEINALEADGDGAGEIRIQIPQLASARTTDDQKAAINPSAPKGA